MSGQQSPARGGQRFWQERFDAVKDDAGYLRVVLQWALRQAKAKDRRRELAEYIRAWPHFK